MTPPLQGESMKPDYDTQRAEAVLVTCEVCQKAYWMTVPQPVCVLCRRMK